MSVCGSGRFCHTQLKPFTKDAVSFNLTEKQHMEKHENLKTNYLNFELQSGILNRIIKQGFGLNWLSSDLGCILFYLKLTGTLFLPLTKCLFYVYLMLGWRTALWKKHLFQIWRPALPNSNNSKLVIQYIFLFIHLAETVLEMTMNMLQRGERLLKCKF